MSTLFRGLRAVRAANLQTRFAPVQRPLLPQFAKFSTGGSAVKISVGAVKSAATKNTSVTTSALRRSFAGPAIPKPHPFMTASLKAGMPQLVPFYFVNQVVYSFALFTGMLYILSRYVLPRFVRLFLSRTFITKI